MWWIDAENENYNNTQSWSSLMHKCISFRFMGKMGSKKKLWRLGSYFHFISKSIQPFRCRVKVNEGIYSTSGLVKNIGFKPFTAVLVGHDFTSIIQLFFSGASLGHCFSAHQSEKQKKKKHRCKMVTLPTPKYFNGVCLSLAVYWNATFEKVSRHGDHCDAQNCLSSHWWDACRAAAVKAVHCSPERLE